MIILNFNRPLEQNNHVLHFGDKKQHFWLSLKVTLSFGRKVHLLKANNQIKLKGKLSLNYHANVFRGLSLDVCQSTMMSKKQAIGGCITWQNSQNVITNHHQTAQTARRISATHCLVLQNKPLHQNTTCHQQHTAKYLVSTVCDGFFNLYRHKIQGCHTAGVAVKWAMGACDEYFNLPKVTHALCHHGKTAIFDSIGRCFRLSVGAWGDYPLCHHSKTAQIPPMLCRVRVIDNGDDTHTLNFTCLLDETNTVLHFGAVCQGQNKPTDGTIVIVNDVSIKINGKTLDCFGVNVAIDSQSYAWSMSADVARHHLADVNIFDGFKEALVTINGYEWRFIIDGVSDNQAFGQNSLSLQGKSRAVLLAEPFFSVGSQASQTPITAQQLATEQLNRHSVPSGFVMDWQMTDWLIGQYAYYDKTPINILSWLTETTGGFINAHPNQDVIIAKQHYPYARWELPTPDKIIPNRLILDLSTQRTQTPNYNGVYVSGVYHGVSMLVKRQGTSGGYRGAMVSHELITDETASRVRGIYELSKVGDRINLSLSTPFHADIGLLVPSDLVGVGGMTGLVRSVSISCRVEQNGAVVVRQSLTVEI